MAASVIRTCDVAGEATPAVATHKFSIEGQPYVLDLGEDAEKDFDQFVTYWLNYANPDNSVKPAKASKSRGASSSKAPTGNTAVLRAWAKANGWPDLGTRGRIPQEAKDSYAAAGSPGEVEGADDTEAEAVDAE